MIVTKEETLSIRAYLREESRHSKLYWNCNWIALEKESYSKHYSHNKNNAINNKTVNE